MVFDYLPNDSALYVCFKMHTQLATPISLACSSDTVCCGEESTKSGHALEFSAQTLCLILK